MDIRVYNLPTTNLHSINTCYQSLMHKKNEGSVLSFEERDWIDWANTVLDQPIKSETVEEEICSIH